GFMYLFTFVVVVFANFAIFARLSVKGDAAATAQNILAHEGLFRVYMALDLVYCIGAVVLLTALYTLLGPVHRSLALAAAISRVIFTLMWMISTAGQLFALRILHGA